MSLVVGVLGLQGDIEEHLSAVDAALSKMGARGEAVVVKAAEDVKGLDVLTIPGGESTVMGGLSSIKGLMPAVRERVAAGMPTLGTCAGMIMLAKRAQDRVVGETHQPLLGMVDMTVERNAFGRQRESFEATLDLGIPGGERYRGVFIRAPSVLSVGPGVRELARLGGAIVAVQQGNILATAFHPELSRSTVLHEHLFGLAAKGAKA